MSEKIIQGLAGVESVRDFRLKKFMVQMGLDPAQPVLFYRGLISGAKKYTGALTNMCQLALDRLMKIRALESRINDLEGQVATTQSWQRQAQKEKQRADANANEIQHLTPKLDRHYLAVKVLLNELRPGTFNMTGADSLAGAMTAKSVKEEGEFHRAYAQATKELSATYRKVLGLD